MDAGHDRKSKSVPLTGAQERHAALCKDEGLRALPGAKAEHFDTKLASPALEGRYVSRATEI